MKKIKASSASNPFALLPDDFLTQGPIFEFVGPDEYRYLASVNKRFRDIYTDFQEKWWKKEVKRRFPESHEEKLELMGTTKLTSFGAASSSLDRGEVFLNETEGFAKAEWAKHHLRIHHNQAGSTFLIQPPRYSYTCPSYLLREGAVQHNHFLVWKWLILRQPPVAEFGDEDDFQFCSLAAKYGCLRFLKCARQEGCHWNERTCADAARNGHLEVLQWARQEGCPWDEETCVRAAENGHLEALQWARQEGCPWDHRTCAWAARNGHLEMLQWARQEGCPWNEYTCKAAAKNGHLEVLKWARQEGCPWGRDTCEYAARNSHLEVLKWARRRMPLG